MPFEAPARRATPAMVSPAAPRSTSSRSAASSTARARPARSPTRGRPGPRPVRFPGSARGSTTRTNRTHEFENRPVTTTATRGERAVPDRNRQHAALAGITAVLFGGAIAGFFYAWVCSTMWGLDAADPRVAVAAMQAMNASVRNAAFAPAFFGTPLVMAVAAGLALRAGGRGAALLFLAAAAVYASGGMGLTLVVNVPMNEQLAAAAPTTVEQAGRVWSAYSGPWQLANQVRALLSGVALGLAAAGLWALGPCPARWSAAFSARRHARSPR